MIAAVSFERMSASPTSAARTPCARRAHVDSEVVQVAIVHADECERVLHVCGVITSTSSFMLGERSRWVRRTVSRPCRHTSVDWYSLTMKSLQWMAARFGRLSMAALPRGEIAKG